MKKKFFNVRKLKYKVYQSIRIRISDEAACV